MSTENHIDRDTAVLGERMARVETRLETIEGDVSDIKGDVSGIKAGQADASRERSAHHAEMMGAIKALAIRVDVVSAGQAGLVATFRAALVAMPPTAWWIIGSAITATLAGAFGYTYSAAPVPPQIDHHEQSEHHEATP